MNDLPLRLHHSPLCQFANPHNIEIDGTADTVEASLKADSIKLHPLCLISPLEIPIFLQASGPHDPILKDLDHIANIKKWIANKANLQIKDLHNFETTYRFFLHLWKKPKMVDRVIQFAIAHEIGHLVHQHTHRSWELFFTIFLGFAPFCVTSPLAYASMRALLTMAIVHPVFKALRQTSERHFEYESDKYALAYTQDPEAGETLLKCIQKAEADNWREKSLFKKLWTIISIPEKVFPLTRPTPLARIHQLWQNWA